MATTSPLVSPSSEGSRSLAVSARTSGRHNKGNIRLVYLQCYFVTIATILGTGILGLPVTLADSGLYPFLVSFVLGFLVQALLVCFFTDILQRAHAVQVNCAKDNRHGESLPLNDFGDDEDFEDLEEEHETNGPVLAGHVIIPKDINIRPPNLHLLGEMFLGCGVRQLFYLVLLLHFVAFLISYALAGSQAYAEIIGVNPTYVVPVFVWVLTFAIVFALQAIQPVVSILTFAKGSVLLATVIVTFFVGAQVNHEVTNDFHYMGAPFLMGTVALAGVINVMPFLYGKIKPIPSQVSGFRASILMGLTTCMVLNILWCWAVLGIVPQQNSCFTFHPSHNASIRSILLDDLEPPQAACTQNVSLKSAGANGEIATIPLTQIIHELYPEYDWVALLIEVFIVISITVSYLTIGAAMHHTLNGSLESLWSQDKFNSYTEKIKVTTSNRLTCCNIKCILRSALSLLVFGIIFIIALLNPKAFVPLLEKAGSLVANVEAGIFVFLMMQRALNKENKKLKIPVPLPNVVYHLQYLMLLYFTFAVGYDIYLTVMDVLHHGTPQTFHIDHPSVFTNQSHSGSIVIQNVTSVLNETALDV